MTTILPQSVFAVLTGAVNSGKSYQVASVLIARVDGQPFALPALVIMTEASSEGTMGEVLLDPGACVVWPCTDSAQAREALLACFPDSGPLTLGEAKAAAYKAIVDRCVKDKTVPPAPPAAHPHDRVHLRALVVDTISTLYKGDLQVAYRELLEGSKQKETVKRGGKGAEYNDPRELHRIAAKRCGDLIDRLNGVSMRHRGLVVLVSCHTQPAMQKNGEDAIQVGEGPLLGGLKTSEAGLAMPGYSATWDSLAAKATVIWHCFETAPDLRGGSISDINDRAENDAKAGYGVITRKGIYPGRGPVLWIKRQNGEGPLGIFGVLPAYWHPSATVPEHIAAISPTPDLGRVLAYAIESCRAQTASAAG